MILKLKFDQSLKARFKKVFLLFSRWCDNCELGYWLMKVLYDKHKDYYLCPKCGGYIFAFKSNAIKCAQKRRDGE